MKAKRIISLILVLCMCVAWVPVKSEAASNTDIQQKMIEIVYNGAGGRMTCDFDGYVNTSGRHEGIDFVGASGAGSSIYSLISGTVTKVSNASSLSTLAIYDEVNNKTVVYLHGVYSVAEGSQVSQGQYIGYESNLGATAAHTHIEVRNGRKTSAAKSVNDSTLDNENPYSYWGSVLFSAPANPPASVNSPVGVVDSVSGGVQSVTVRGWAFDEDTPTEALEIHVYIGGPAGSGIGGYGGIIANVERTDVGNAYPGVGNYHGYEATLYTTLTGSQPVYVYAINVGSGENKLLGSQTVHISENNAPVGTVDSIIPGSNKVNVYGWVYDEDDLNRAVELHVYIGTTFIGSGTANLARPDVNATYGVGDYHGFNFDCEVSSSLGGSQTVTVYAIDNETGNNPIIGSASVNIPVDTKAPVISDVTVSNVSSTGYTVSCTVTDESGVDRVQFPTWTAPDQDDIPSDWGTNPVASGTKYGDTYTYRVNISDHNNERIGYTTHIYAYDKYGNVACFGLGSLDILDDTKAPVISDVTVSDVSSTGYTVSCTVTDENGVDRVQFPTWTEYNWQDDLLSNWEKLPEASGSASGSTYTFRVKTSAHNNESGEYITHIYAYDTYGNYSVYDVLSVMVPCVNTAHQDADHDGLCDVCKTAMLLGDLNLDGLVDSDDLTLLARHVGGIELLTANTALTNADVNSDGQINSDDLTIHARYVGGIIADWENT